MSVFKNETIKESKEIRPELKKDDLIKKLDNAYGKKSPKQEFGWYNK